jgi:hypothetical protein
VFTRTAPKERVLSLNAIWSVLDIDPNTTPPQPQTAHMRHSATQKIQPVRRLHKLSEGIAIS